VPFALLILTLSGGLGERGNPQACRAFTASFAIVLCVFRAVSLGGSFGERDCRVLAGSTENERFNQSGKACGGF